MLSAKQIAPAFFCLLRKVQPALLKTDTGVMFWVAMWASVPESSKIPFAIDLVFASVYKLLCAKRIKHCLEMNPGGRRGQKTGCILGGCQKIVCMGDAQ